MKGKDDEDGKAQIEKVLKEIERYKAREISLCQKLAVMLPSFPSPPPISQFLFPRWPITAN